MATRTPPKTLQPPVSRPAPRTVLPPFPARDFVLPGLILLGLSLAELITAAWDPRVGLPAHALLLGLLITLGARATDSARRELFWTLTLAPVIRIASLSLPLGRLPLLAWYPLIGVPIFAAAFVTARRLGYTRTQIGLTVSLSQLPLHLALTAMGCVLGLGEYLIFRPAPLAEHFTVEAIWQPALTLLIFTGFEEELIFRGLMQRAALRALGRWGLVYVSLVFAVLHIGYLSVLDLVFVFLVGMLFSVITLRTRSLFGVTLAHGAINAGLFLIYPYLAPVFLGSGYADLVPLPEPVTPR
jgi:membrane protease YdiL (CAAX protease family)